MWCLRALSVFYAVLLLFPVGLWATEGMFQGKVVDAPANGPRGPGWIFVQGRNHMLRRVNVTHAKITFGEQVPVSQRRQCKMDCLQVGQEIRVTADQDSAGEWRAKKIEILQLTTNRTFVAPRRFGERKVGSLLA